MKLLGPPSATNRIDVFRFFNGLSQEAKEGLDCRKLRVPLVKSFLLEHVACNGNNHQKTPEQIFKSLGVEIKTIDDSFFQITSVVQDPGTKQNSMKVTGYLENYDGRFFAYYTCEGATEAKNRVEKWVQHPDLDHPWFSSPLLQSLWDKDVSKRGDARLGKLTFRHKNVFDIPEDSVDGVSSEVDDEEIEYEVGEDNRGQVDEREDRPEREVVEARFEMKDRIGRIKSSLGKLQRDYEPLYVLNALRFPSRTCKGGHDLYQNGRITNRTDSFEDHRNTVRYLYKIYRNVLSYTEEHVWHEISKKQTMGVGFKGVPLIIRFHEELNEKTFQQWMQRAFRKPNVFKLWGNPIRLGATHVHVYGADRHLWQPLNLEITSKGLVAILPKGTCGNTLHRLVANIQHYVCPRIESWIGADSFETVVGQWTNDMEKDSEY